MLKKELNLYTFGDLLNHFPHRHIDKTQVTDIAKITPDQDFVQVRGVLMGMDTLGEKRAKRLVSQLRDATGQIELAWFQGINWVQKQLVEGQTYIVFGRVSFFNGRAQKSR